MDEINGFLQAGIDRVYPGKWEVVGGGFGTKVEVDNVGILVIHSDQFIHFAAGLLGGLEYSIDLVRHVSKQHCGAPFGALVLSEGQTDFWMLAYGFKLARKWLDLLGYIPGYVNGHIEEIRPQFGGYKWGIEEGWWYRLMDRY
jgi:hypothetical protein